MRLVDHRYLSPLAAAERLAPELLGPLAPAFEEVLEHVQSHYALMKAFLLADDHKITDTTILRQIAGDPRWPRPQIVMPRRPMGSKSSSSS